MQVKLLPDSIHYLRAAEGLRVPVPYNRRWLLPRILGPHPGRWYALTCASLAALPFVAALYFFTRGLDGTRIAFATALICALPGLRLAARFPVLIDAPSFTGALLVASLASVAPWWVTLPLSLVIGATRETAPVFAALWSWSPLPLAGLLAVGWLRPAAVPSPDEPWLSHPYREAWRERVRIRFDRLVYVAPWGAALAGLCVPTWQMAVTVLAAHAQLFAAVDTLRLTVWAGPVLVLGAAQLLPPEAWAIALLVTVMHRDDRTV